MESVIHLFCKTRSLLDKEQRVFDSKMQHVTCSRLIITISVNQAF